MLKRLRARLAALIERRRRRHSEKAAVKKQIRELRKRRRRKLRAIKKLNKRIGEVKGKIKDAKALDPKGGEVVTWEGKPVVEWIAYWLQRAREKGWKGAVNSGYRSPEYSEQLCYQICGAPSCPGRCAGRSSNHTQKGYLQGAVDVSDPEHFGQLMDQLGSPLHNALGAADPWHFSATGR